MEELNTLKAKHAEAIVKAGGTPPPAPTPAPAPKKGKDNAQKSETAKPAAPTPSASKPAASPAPAAAPSAQKSKVVPAPAPAQTSVAGSTRALPTAPKSVWKDDNPKGGAVDLTKLEQWLTVHSYIGGALPTKDDRRYVLYAPWAFELHACILLVLKRKGIVIRTTLYKLILNLLFLLCGFSVLEALAGSSDLVAVINWAGRNNSKLSSAVARWLRYVTSVSPKDVIAWK